MPLPSYPWVPTPLQSQLVSLHSWWERGGWASEDTQGTFLGERAWQKSKQSTGKTAQECFMICRESQQAGWMLGRARLQRGCVIDGLLSQWAGTQERVSQPLALPHVHRLTARCTHTIPGHISPHTLLPSCLPGFWQWESVTHKHTHTLEGMQRFVWFHKSGGGGGQGGTGDPTFYFVNLAGLVVLYIFDSQKRPSS